MKNKTAKVLPKIEAERGTVHRQFVRCGKPGCKCARGELHKAFYRFWRESGRLRKQYVRASEVDAVREACAARQVEQHNFRQLKREFVASHQQFRLLLTQIRRHESLICKHRNQPSA